MPVMNIDCFKPHPENTVFFDDMTGEKWNDFVENIRTRGVREAIIVTPDMVIVSGHQRVRACKELGITEIPYEIRYYQNEDEVVLDLIEINVQQRGNIGGSDLKLARRSKELKRIYNITPNRSFVPQSSNGTVREKTSSEIAEMLGVSSSKLKKAEILMNLVPELLDLVDDGTINSSVAERVIAKLSPEEQRALLNAIGSENIGNYTMTEMESVVKQNQELQAKIEEYEERLSNVSQSGIKKEDQNFIDEMQKKIDEMQIKLRQAYEYKAQLQSENRALKNKPIVTVNAIEQVIKSAYTMLSDAEVDTIISSSNNKGAKCKTLIENLSVLLQEILNKAS